MNIRRRLRLITDVRRENQAFGIGPVITLASRLFSLPMFISSLCLIGSHLYLNGQVSSYTSLLRRFIQLYGVEQIL